jgi:hypothetical protein
MKILCKFPSFLNFLFWKLPLPRRYRHRGSAAMDISD